MIIDTAVGRCENIAGFRGFGRIIGNAGSRQIFEGDFFHFQTVQDGILRESGGKESDKSGQKRRERAKTHHE